MLKIMKHRQKIFISFFHCLDLFVIMFKKWKWLIDDREVEEDSEDEEAQLDEKLAELKEEEQKALKR